MTEVLPGASFLLAGGAHRHAGFAALRSAGPVTRVALPSGTPVWVVTGYDAVREALLEPRLRGRTGAVGDRRELPEELRMGMNTHMLNLEPPDHTRLRRLIMGEFTHRRIERLRPRIQKITDELLDAVAGRDEVDLVEALALPLPIRVLSELLGVPREQADTFHGWTTTLTASALPVEHLRDAASQMLHYIRELLDRKRREPGDDLLSALVRADDGEDRLAEHELTSMVFLLLIAGHETTVNLIGNATIALLTHPDELARLRADPGLVPSAIEELLRYESPVQVAMRHSTEAVELAGVTIPGNSTVMVALLSANRDPDRFAEPDRLDLARTDNAQVAFGYGIHHCLGAPLARLDGAVAIGTLLTRFPRLRLAVPVDALQWRVSMVMHGIAALPVRLR